MNEHNEQVAFFKVVDLYAITDPRYKCIFAVPNAFKRTPRQGKWMKDEGLKAGVPDIVVAYPSGQYHGLFIEMKTRSGRLSAAQREWIERVRWAGYRAEVCFGCDDALDTVQQYFGGHDD